jgi:uncharacterized cupredoxin-like copper-binding protein
MKFVLLFAGGVLAVAGVAYWASPVDHAGDTGIRRIVMTDMRFTPNRIDAAAGQTLTLQIENRGVSEHDLNFGSIHMAGLSGAQSIVKPGEVRTLRLRVDSPGAHVFTCSQPGHAAAGMTGAIFVHD